MSPLAASATLVCRVAGQRLSRSHGFALVNWQGGLIIRSILNQAEVGGDAVRKDSYCRHHTNKSNYCLADRVHRAHARADDGRGGAGRGGSYYTDAE